MDRIAGRDVDALAAAAARLRELHVPGRPLVLPNAWDPASAGAVEAAGFSAVATTSAGVAAALGYADGEATPPGAMFEAIARIASAVSVPVTADIEAGYGLAPSELVERLVEAGACGCNIEDTDHREGGLVDPALHADRIGQLRSAASRAGARS